MCSEAPSACKSCLSEHQNSDSLCRCWTNISVLFLTFHVSISQTSSSNRKRSVRHLWGLFFREIVWQFCALVSYPPSYVDSFFFFQKENQSFRLLCCQMLMRWRTANIYLSVPFHLLHDLMVYLWVPVGVAMPASRFAAVLLRPQCDLRSCHAGSGCSLVRVELQDRLDP